MRILIIKTYPKEINSDVYNVQEIGLARAFVKKGHQCDILCCCDKEPSVKEIQVENNKRIKIYCNRALKILKNGIFFGTKGLFKNYDILQAAEYNQIFTWYLARKYKEKLTVYHGPYYSSFNKRYNMMCKIFDCLCLGRYKKNNTLFFTKSILAEDFLREKNLCNVKTTGVGIDLACFQQSYKVMPEFLKQLAEFNKTYRLIYIGRIEPRRNSLFLLDVLKELINAGVDVGMVIVGDGETEYVKQFFEYTKDLQLENNILYTSVLEQKYMKYVYNSGDIFLLPTLYEIFGMVLLEAMYFSLPVITSMNGGSKTLIQNNTNGLIIKDFDVKEWAEKISGILNDNKRKEQLGEQAHKTITENYTWDKLSEIFLSEYTSMLK